MPDYLVFAVDNEGRDAGPLFIFTCDHDEQAIDRARKLKRDVAVEVWQTDRLVAKVE
jgi:hypothetical protein